MLGCMSFFFVNGMLVLMTSSLLINLMRAYQLTYDRGGLLLTVQALASLLTNLLSAPLAQRFGRKRVLVLTAAGFAVSFSLIALTPPLPLLYGALFLSGLAWGSSNNLINYLVVRATDGDTARISLVHTSFSLGALLAPLAVALTVSLQIDWRWAAALVGLLAAILIPVTLAMPIKESDRSGSTAPGAVRTFLRDWRLYLFMAILFLYVGIEVGFGGWLVTYLTTWRNLTQPFAQTLLSALWIAMISGRILLALFGRNLRKARFLFLEGIGICAGAFLLIRASHPVWLTAAVLLLGLSLSGFYGMVVANASRLVQSSSLASGLLMSLGGLGASVMPLLTGIVAETGGIVAGLWVLFTAAVLLLVLTALNAWCPE
jgi:fucose permease